MSDLSDDEIRERLRGVSFRALGPRTVKNITEVLEAVHRAQRQGFALNDQELTLGHRSVATPIRDHSGGVIAAISVSVPSVRVSAKRLQQIARNDLIPAAADISAALAAPAAA
jgi:IclR family pca regulon transcriptional regulator